jgi:sulfite exporter TauE/SafE
MASLHCLTMCGPLVAVACHAPSGPALRTSTAAYLAGRSLGYGMLGAAVGALTHPFMTGSFAHELRLGVALLGAGWLLSRALRWLRPPSQRSLIRLRRRPATPSWIARIVAFLPRRGFGLGLATALFPCGALLAAAVAAAMTGSALRGAVFMLVFSAASAPALIVLGDRLAGLAARVSGRTRMLVGASLVTVAVVIVATPFYTAKTGHCACPTEHP